MSILEPTFILGVMGSMQEFAQLLRSEMERQGIEGQEIATKLELGPSLVSDILNAKKKNPPAPEVFKGFGRVLGISQEQMLQALGYLDEKPEDAAAWDATIPQAVREALQGIDWSTSTAVTRTLVMLQTVRDAQRGGMLSQMHDPSEVEQRGIKGDGG